MSYNDALMSPLLANDAHIPIPEKVITMYTLVSVARIPASNTSTVAMSIVSTVAITPVTYITSAGYNGIHIPVTSSPIA